MTNKQNHHLPDEEKPPLFKNWGTWYTLVLLNLGALIIFFYVITRVFQ